jgi:transposase-like protein
MRNYSIISLTVEDIRNKYDISVSTLYSWKGLFQKHKKIWLGLLNDAVTSPLEFIDSFFFEGKSLTIIPNGGLILAI